MTGLEITEVCSNMFGHPLGGGSAKRLTAYLEHPTEQTWGDAYPVIICGGPGAGEGVTCWQAWAAWDDDAPRRSVWDAWPTADTLYVAILEAQRAVADGAWRVGLNRPGWLRRMRDAEEALR